MEAARLARLGVVEEPEVGHETFIGRLSIPYVTKTGVVDIRFRALNPAVEPKYMGMVGSDTKLYNVLDIERAGNHIGICEGEIDTLTMSTMVGIACVGVPGANSWKKHYTRLLADFEREKRRSCESSIAVRGTDSSSSLQTCISNTTHA